MSHRNPAVGPCARCGDLTVHDLCRLCADLDHARLRLKEHTAGCAKCARMSFGDRSADCYTAGRLARAVRAIEARRTAAVIGSGS